MKNNFNLTRKPTKEPIIEASPKAIKMLKDWIEEEKPKLDEEWWEKHGKELVEGIGFEKCDITIDRGSKDDIVSDDNGNNYIVGEDRKLTRIVNKAHLVEGTSFITKEEADLQDKFADFKTLTPNIKWDRNYMDEKFNYLWYDNVDVNPTTEHGKKHPYDTGYKNKGRTVKNKKNRLKSQRAKKARKKNR